MANYVNYRLRGDISEVWEDKNPILAMNEPAYDMTNNRLKFGDGFRTWNELPYLAPDVVDELNSEDDKAALSANQGRLLKNEVDTKASNEDLSSLKSTVNGLQTQLNNLTIPDGVTVLDSFTANKTAALSANKGKELNDNKADKTAVSSLQTTVNSISSTVNSNTTKITNLQTTVNNKADTTEVTNLQNTVNNIQTVINSGSITGGKYRLTRKIIASVGAVYGDYSDSTDGIPDVGSMPYFLVPDGVEGILISGCAGGEGLSYDVSNKTFRRGRSGAQTHSALYKVNPGDKISYYVGRGGYGWDTSRTPNNQIYSPSCGQDTVVYINGVMRIRLAGGGASKYGFSVTQNMYDVTSPLSMASPDSAGDLTNFYSLFWNYIDMENASDRTSVWYTTFRKFLSLLTNALFQEQTMFSPYGNGGALLGGFGFIRRNPHHGEPGCIVFEYVEPIS